MFTRKYYNFATKEENVFEYYTEEEIQQHLNACQSMILRKIITDLLNDRTELIQSLSNTLYSHADGCDECRAEMDYWQKQLPEYKDSFRKE